MALRWVNSNAFEAFILHYSSYEHLSKHIKRARYIHKFLYK